MSEITVRNMGFEFADDCDLILFPGDPEASYNQLGFSMTLPYLEPYLMRTMAAALPHITDPELAADMKQFSAQEGQHYRAHMKLNDVVRARTAGNVQALEDALEADYQRFTKTKSLRFNLAYAEGFEAMTTALALGGLLHEELMPPQGCVGAELFQWHLMEELEHRTVAFDAYEHVSGSYPYRVVVSMFAQWHFLRYVDRFFKCLLAADTEALHKYGGRAGRTKRMLRLLGVFLRYLVPMILRTYSPWYTPRNLRIPATHQALAAKYTAAAVWTA